MSIIFVLKIQRVGDSNVDIKDDLFEMKVIFIYFLKLSQLLAVTYLQVYLPSQNIEINDLLEF